MYYTLLKCCHNMLRHAWAEHLPQPAPWASPSAAAAAAAAPGAAAAGAQHAHHQAHQGGMPVVRLAEAKQVLLALGTSLEARGAHSLLLQQPSAGTWMQYAISAYRDMVARGFKPNIDILDKCV